MSGTRSHDELCVQATRESLGRGVRPPFASLAACAQVPDARERAVDQERVQRARRMMELGRRLSPNRQRSVRIEQ